MIKCLLSALCLSISSFISAYSPENPFPFARFLYNQSYEYVSSLIPPSEVQEIYKGDLDYLKAFPLTLYKIDEVPSQGMFFDDQIDDSIKNYLRNHWVWEPDIKRFIEILVTPGTIAIDIGAHVGTHTVTLSKAVGAKGRVFAFEPNRKIYRELCMNMALNDCYNVTAIRSAIGKKHSVIQVVESHPRNEGGSYVIDHVGGSNTAYMLQLDDFQFTNVSFIKIDVENMEADVIDGALETLKRCRPILLLEIQGNGERPIQLGEDSAKMGQECIQKIKNIGYRLTHIGGADYLAYPN
jgi:FkbM family methyltransferase